MKNKEELIRQSPYPIGMRVFVEPVRPFCTGGDATIEEIDVRYDNMTGEPFRVYKINDRWWDERGGCYSQPEFMYDVIYNYYQNKDDKEEELKEKIISIEKGGTEFDGMEYNNTLMEYSNLIKTQFKNKIIPYYIWYRVPNFVNDGLGSRAYKTWEDFTSSKNFEFKFNFPNIKEIEIYETSEDSYLGDYVIRSINKKEDDSEYKTNICFIKGELPLPKEELYNKLIKIKQKQNENSI